MHPLLLRPIRNRLRGEHSAWFGYLQSLPRDTVEIALFWGVDDAVGHRRRRAGDLCESKSEFESAHGFSDEAANLRQRDGHAAAAWLPGTQVERELRTTPLVSS